MARPSGVRGPPREFPDGAVGAGRWRPRVVMMSTCCDSFRWLAGSEYECSLTGVKHAGVGAVEAEKSQSLIFPPGSLCGLEPATRAHSSSLQCDRSTRIVKSPHPRRLQKPFRPPLQQRPQLRFPAIDVPASPQNPFRFARQQASASAITRSSCSPALSAPTRPPDSRTSISSRTSRGPSRKFPIFSCPCSSSTSSSPIKSRLGTEVPAAQISARNHHRA